MVMQELTDEQKQKLQAAIKERFAKNGFDPEDMWAWYERIHNGTPVTLRELQQKILGEAKRRGWLAEANLDYEPQPVEKKGDIPLSPDYDWDIKVWVDFGGSEGIYLDWEYRGRYFDDSIKRIPDSYGCRADLTYREVVRHGQRHGESQPGWNVTYRLHCGKTLDEDLGGMERMSLLCGRLLWLVREIPV